MTECRLRYPQKGKVTEFFQAITKKEKQKTVLDPVGSYVNSHHLDFAGPSISLRNKWKSSLEEYK